MRFISSNHFPQPTTVSLLSPGYNTRTVHIFTAFGATVLLLHYHVHWGTAPNALGLLRRNFLFPLGPITNIRKHTKSKIAASNETAWWELVLWTQNGERCLPCWCTWAAPWGKIIKHCGACSPNRCSLLPKTHHGELSSETTELRKFWTNDREGPTCRSSESGRLIHEGGLKNRSSRIEQYHTAVLRAPLHRNIEYVPKG